VPGFDGEEVPAETIVPDAKAYILETINNPEALYDPEIWDTPGFTLVLSWLAQKWQQKCRKLAPRGNKNPVQYLTKEQQKACLDSAGVDLIGKITKKRQLTYFGRVNEKNIRRSHDGRASFPPAAVDEASMPAPALLAKPPSDRAPPAAPRCMPVADRMG